jgi:hypothetical protein
MENQKQISENIRIAIINVALREDAILTATGKGILVMPEVAFAFEVGKEIYLTRRTVLLNENYEWNREVKLKKDSKELTDLVFENKKNKNDIIAIEFKILSKEDEYQKDIDKLKSLPNNYLKIFCALEDILASKKEEDSCRRIFRLKENGQPIKQIGEKFFIKTWHWLKKEYLCSVEVWEVN